MKVPCIAVTLLLLLSSAAFGQTLLDVSVYEPPGSDDPRLGAAHPRLADQIAGRGNGRLPGTRRIVNGPTGIPERATRFQPPGYRGPAGEVTGHGRRRGGSAGRVVYLSRHEVDVRIVDGAAITTIDQTFRNEAGVVMEGTYLLELPEGSVIDGFSIFMEGREVHGEVMASARGRRIYEEIVRRKKDPGLVELVAGDAPSIKTRIFPIPARGDFRVKTRYSHVMRKERDTYTTLLPLRDLGVDEARPIDRLSLSLTARASRPLTAVSAPEYDLSGLAAGARRVWGGRYRASRCVPENDLSIRCVPRASESGLALHVHTARTGERYFMAVVSAGEGALLDPALDFGELETGDVYPAAIPDLAPGRQTLVFGRLLGSRMPFGVLRGRSAGEAVLLRATASSCRAPEEGTGFIAALWAVRRVGDLLEACGDGELDEVTLAEVTALGERYGILTPCTVFLAR